MRKCSNMRNIEKLYILENPRHFLDVSEAFFRCKRFKINQLQCVAFERYTLRSINMMGLPYKLHNLIITADTFGGIETFSEDRFKLPEK
jgi:hypothetical protein